MAHRHRHPQYPYLFLTEQGEASQIEAKAALAKWGKVFIKAASQGSSVGCYSASNEADLVKGIADAFGYSEQVLIEKAVKPRELEVAVYQYGDELVATYPGRSAYPRISSTPMKRSTAAPVTPRPRSRPRD